MTDRPLLLDLFCGAGGCSEGYHRAGFDVVGVDWKPQKHYPFPFVEWDALDALKVLLEGCCLGDSHGADWSLHDFAAIHASPPCQFHTALRSIAEASATTPRNYVDLIPQTRELLERTELPWVIENVPGAKTHNPTLMLCGSMFKLGTNCGAELQRHRHFEFNWPCGEGPKCEHGWASDGPHRTIGCVGYGSPIGGRWQDQDGPPFETNTRYRRTICVTGNGMGRSLDGRRRTITVTGHTAQQNTVRNQVREVFDVAAARQAMGIPWMTMRELSQAIPPAYTEWIGRELMEHLGRAR